MADTIDFVLNGRAITLSRRDVVTAVRGVVAGPVRSHSVCIDGTRYPVKQVFELATGLDRLDFTSAVARRTLIRLDFEVERS